MYLKHLHTSFTVIIVALSISGCTVRSVQEPVTGSFLEGIDSVSISTDEDEALDHYLSGSIHEEAGDLYMAAVEYQLALLYDETSAAIRLALANVYAIMGERSSALLVLEAGRNLNPQDEELLKLLVDEYLRAGRRNSAADCYLDIAETRQLGRIELLRLAAILSVVNRYDESLATYREYIERFGMDADVYYKIGLIHLNRRDIAAAETTYQRLVELDSSQHRVFYVLGGFAVSREEWTTAEENFRRALEIDSTELRYWTNLLLTLNEQNKEEEALTVVDEALERFEEVPLLYDIHTGVLERLSRLDEALESADKSIELDSTRLQPYLSKGYICHELERWYESSVAYERALEINPDNPLVLNNFAYMLSEQNHRLEDGLAMVERALEIDPDNASYLDTRAWLLYRLGRSDEALSVIKQAVRKAKDNAELYEHQGFIYQALGKESQARKAWRRAYELDPDNEEYHRLAN